MANDPQAMANPTEQKPDGLTTLLWRLPAEVRLQIYRLALPEPRHFYDVLAIQPNLSWLGTSRAIFCDAAPFLYGKTALYFDLEPGARTSRGGLQAAVSTHVQTHYPGDAAWIEQHICTTLTEKVMIEVWCASCENLEDLITWFTSPSSGCGTLSNFHNLRDLCISLRNLYIGPLDSKVLCLRNEPDDSVWEKAVRTRNPAPLWTICREMRVLRQQLPAACRVHWTLPGVEVTEVAFLRANVPEQVQTAGERHMTQLMRQAWTFVRERSEDELDGLMDWTGE